MSTTQLYLARLMFKNKIVMSNGQAFEDLFVRIMQIHEPTFIPIKASGRKGDLGNDGFIPSKGIYFQVYAPEDLSMRQGEAIEKLQHDFVRLHSNWNRNTAIKEFYYVVNDKYKGAHPTLNAELVAIKNAYSVETNSVHARNLEDIFIKMSEDDMIEVLQGVIPIPENSEEIDYSVLGDVINHLNEIEMPFLPESFTLNPDFNEKIKFNKLSKPVATMLEYGRINNYAVNDYFQNNSDFTKDQLRNKFANLYADAITVSPLSTLDGTYNDAIFVSILDKAAPKKTRPHYDAVKLLMSYFFEHCDVFEIPTKAV